MDGFDAIAMPSYMAGPMPLSNATAADAMGVPLLALDNLDHQSNFEVETFAGSEDAAFQHPIQAPPSLKRFPSTFDDPFSDALSVYEQHPNMPEQNGAPPESPAVERGDKLLSFSIPSLPYALLDYAYRRTTISMSAQLHGMFFLAESPWAATDNATPPQTELTCYRRNLFQVTGAVTLPRALQCILTEQGEQIPIIGLELTISATESVEGNPVKIISVPWKTPAGSTQAAEDKTEKEPPSIALDLSNGQDVDSEFVNIPIAWKRLQFRIATANNGRRKELQQHFVVRLKVMAALTSGTSVPICEVQSGAVIVRGRSPRNFVKHKDFPIPSANTARKHAPPQPTRTSTGETNQNTLLAPQPTPTKSMEVPQLFDYAPNELQVSPDFFEWKIPVGQTGAMTALPPDPAFGLNSAAYAKSSPDLSRYPVPAKPPSAPINLSLTDEEPKKPQSPPEHVKKAKFSHQPVRPPSFSFSLLGSPDESADLLYEYFPLGLDDWMPPVDAVYRPHVVHHTILPQDPKVMAIKSRSKRYFSEDT